MDLPEKVLIRDVTLRDGLQNESIFVNTDVKVEGLQKIIDGGFQRIEVTSFVHPKWVPALSDADDFSKKLPRKPGVTYDALIPNRRGLERFLETTIDTAVFFLSASTKHNKANVNTSTEETLDQIKDLIIETKSHNRQTMGGIATAFVCPYAGIIPYEMVEQITRKLVESGIDEIGLGDTIGQATPKMVYEYCVRLKETFPDLKLSLHLHDTYGYALSNIMAGIQAGVYIYDVAQAGLGGCPYAPGSTGNVKASYVVEFLEKQNIDTALDLEQIKSMDEYFYRLVKN